MTPDDQQFILAAFTQQLIANGGNRITDALGHGLIAALTEITSKRLTQPQEQQPQEQQPQQN